ncbi:MAG: hypothetical protein H6560_17550 [Lewinellaceae bacterium]|nr:hypothetical protein [Lewinellaceae bacterium]
MQRILLSLLIIISLATAALAQEDLATHFMRHTWQSSRTNPAFFPDYQAVIGLPGVYNTLYVTNVTYGDLIAKGENGKDVLNINQAIEQLGENNILRNNLDIETLSLGMRFGKAALSLGHTLRFNAFMNYPKTMPQLIWQGNAQFIGQEVEFGPDVDLFGYQEFALGLAVDVAPGFTIGGRAKLLAGVGSISSERTSLRLRTDSEIYQLELNADYYVNSAGSIKYDGFDKLTVAFDYGRFDFEELFTGNTGFAFDLGVQLQLGEKLELAASALDIGKVNWKEEVTNYHLNGTFQYEGLDPAQNIFEDTVTVGSIIDTLREIYEVVETSVNYSTTLPARFYLSGLYHLKPGLSVGGLIYLEQYREEWTTAVAIGGNMDILPVLNVGATYAFRNERLDNLGLNATLLLGPVQLMAATDNIVTAIRPKDSHSANLRLGLNLLLGRVRPEKPEAKAPSGFY